MVAGATSIDDSDFIVAAEILASLVLYNFDLAYMCEIEVNSF